MRATVAAFAAKELAPHVAGWYEDGTLPEDLGPKLGALGLLGMHLEGYGCAGMSATAYGVACRELDMPLGPAMELDAMTQALLMTTYDHAEFHAAFNDKRPPEWTGR